MGERKLYFRFALLLTSLGFLAGAAACSVVCFFSVNNPSFVFFPTEDGGLVFSLLSSLLLPGVCLLFSTSVLGYLVIPFFAFARGFLLTCGLDMLLRIQLLPPLRSMLLVGLPAVLSVPAFFLICEDCILSSRLLRLCSSSSLLRMRSCLDMRRLFLAFALIFASVALRLLLMNRMI